MKEMKLSDFSEMLQTSASKAVIEADEYPSTGDVEITLVDETGAEYYIEDVKFNPETGTITIEFDHMEH